MPKRIDELQNGFSIFEFQSSFPIFLPKVISKVMTFPKKMRCLFRSINGYQLFYIMDKENVVGYCFIKRNYLGKYAFMEKDDVIINLYMIFEKYRGNHYGRMVVEAAIHAMKGTYHTMWAVVMKENIPSLKTLQKIGFAVRGNGKIAQDKWNLVQEETKCVVLSYCE